MKSCRSCVRSVYLIIISTHPINSTCAFRVQVVDHVLKQPKVSDKELYNRARGLLLLGAIFKSIIPDESDEERRELERCVTPFSPLFSCALACCLLQSKLGWLPRLRNLKRNRRHQRPRCRPHRTARMSCVTDKGTGTQRPVTRHHHTRPRPMLPLPPLILSHPAPTARASLNTYG